MNPTRRQLLLAAAGAAGGATLLAACNDDKDAQVHSNATDNVAKVDSDTGTGTALSAKAWTPGYAPLEQYGGGTDARSDIYSLGATLFALLAGKAPPSATDMAMAGSKQKAPLMSALKSAPPAVVKVIERAMQSMPEARYQSMAEKIGRASCRESV